VRAADGAGKLAVPAYELFSSTEILSCANDFARVKSQAETLSSAAPVRWSWIASGLVPSSAHAEAWA
jgi:hypothetical protein